MGCQTAVLKAAGKCEDLRLNSFNKCKKEGLKRGFVTDAVDLQTTLSRERARPSPTRPAARSPARASTAPAKKIESSCIEPRGRARGRVPRVRRHDAGRPRELRRRAPALPLLHAPERRRRPGARLRPLRRRRRRQRELRRAAGVRRRRRRDRPKACDDGGNVAGRRLQPDLRDRARAGAAAASRAPARRSAATASSPAARPATTATPARATAAARPARSRPATRCAGVAERLHRRSAATASSAGEACDDGGTRRRRRLQRDLPGRERLAVRRPAEHVSRRSAATVSCAAAKAATTAISRPATAAAATCADRERLALRRRAERLHDRSAATASSVPARPATTAASRPATAAAPPATSRAAGTAPAQPSSCSTICGDGLLRGDEACDDGDTSLGRRLQRGLHRRERADAASASRASARRSAATAS